MRVLFTGFEPFGGAPTNCTLLVLDALRSLADRGSLPLGVSSMTTAVLPVTNAGGPARLLAAIEEHRPRLVVCLGEASARSAMDLERTARNRRDYRIPDNDGVLIRGQPIVGGGPDVLHPRLPLEEMRAAAEAAGVACRISDDAGLFLCNQVMYTLLHLIERGGPGHTPEFGAFVHLPLVTEQAGEVRSGERKASAPGPGVLGAGEAVDAVDAACIALDGSGVDGHGPSFPPAASVAGALLAAVGAAVAGSGRQRI